MDVTNYDLFPTRLLTIQFAEVEALNASLFGLFQGHAGFAEGLNMHPDALNLLRMADTVPAVARLREMFLEGLKLWLETERIAAPVGVDLVLFSNYAVKREFTLVHNHNADLVGVYYARTTNHNGSTVHQPEGGDDYFEPGDGVLVLHDPRFNANLTAVCHRDHVKVSPSPGLMLIFPAFVWHSVTPHLGDSPRLSFSMNFTLRWPGGSRAEQHALT